MLDILQAHRELITTIGLALNVTGSITFIIDSKGLSGWLTFMVGHMAQDHGSHDGKKFSKKEMEGLDKRIRLSRTLTLWGFSLFLAGFVMQLIPKVLT